MDDTMIWDGCVNGYICTRCESALHRRELAEQDTVGKLLEREWPTVQIAEGGEQQIWDQGYRAGLREGWQIVRRVLKRVFVWDQPVREQKG